ncbi:MAG: UDP-N-acetylmuramate dehydrogenase [Oscillospiraceae bacterium]
MNKKNVVTKLEDCNIFVQTNINISEYTSFKIGGNADYLVKPKNFTEFVCTINIANDENVNYYIIGNGSNMLISDNGYRGMIILTSNLNEIVLIDENLIECYAGVTVANLCKFAFENSLSGLEFAWGIPGSVGGGVYMNAGAYGGEFKDAIKSCKYINEDGKLEEMDVLGMDMSYRHSFFTDKKLLIMSVMFKMSKAEQSSIKEKMDDYITRRKTKQPLEYPSCGSTFKRPLNGYASALIEECGLKGCRIGGAEVSTKHSGFIINVKKATCKDVLELVAHVKSVVLEKKGIELECEVKTLGL